MTRGEKTLGILAIIFMLVLIGVFAYFLFFSDRTDLVLRFSKNNQERVYRKIETAYEISDYDKTLSLVSDFLVDFPDSSHGGRVMVIAADILLKKGDYSGSRNYVERVFNREKVRQEDYSGAAVVLGKIMRRTGQFDPVSLHHLEDAYYKAGTVGKEEVAGYLGYAYYLKEDYQNAINFYNSASGETAVIGRSEIYITLKKYPEAVQEYLNFFSLYPASREFEQMKTNFLFHTYEYAQFLQGRAQYDMAIEYYLKIINTFRDDPLSDQSLYNIADIYYINKKNDSALLFLDKVLENKPVNADDAALFKKGLIYFEKDKKANALKTFRDLQERYPQSAYAKKSWEWVEVISKDLRY